jgi:hypothetical protein
MIDIGANSLEHIPQREDRANHRRKAIWDYSAPNSNSFFTKERRPSEIELVK